MNRGQRETEMVMPICSSNIQEVVHSMTNAIPSTEYFFGALASYAGEQ